MRPFLLRRVNMHGHQQPGAAGAVLGQDERELPVVALLFLPRRQQYSRLRVRFSMQSALNAISSRASAKPDGPTGKHHASKHQP